jgi:hypothetical protein
MYPIEINPSTKKKKNPHCSTVKLERHHNKLGMAAYTCNLSHNDNWLKSKNLTKAGLVERHYLASMGLWVQTPVLIKKNSNESIKGSKW